MITDCEHHDIISAHIELSGIARNHRADDDSALTAHGAAQDTVRAEFFTNGRYIIYDKANPLGIKADVCAGIVTRHNGRHPVTVAALGFYRAKRLSDHVVIQWDYVAMCWRVT